jgi:glycosyltransferase involved in cell wall biosynthesis
LDTINLCMFAPEFFPVWGGTGSYVIELIKFLPKDVNIQIITLKRQISGMSNAKLTEAAINSIIKRPIEIHYIATSKETFFYNLSFQIACFRHIHSLQKKYQFDILHTQLAHMPDLFQLFGANHIPTVVTIHSTIQMLRDYALMARTMFGTLESSEKNALIFSPILQLMQQNYSKHMSNFIAVSEMTRKFTIDHLNVNEDKISLVYNGVDVNVFHPPEKAELEEKYSRPTIVYIGRIVAKKGIHVLIKAMPKILRSFPQARFLFVGGGNVSVYSDMARAMGISESNFCFLGHLGYFERLKILREATVFVNPSFFENCSLSILEAMSSACAVVASDVGGNPEIISSGFNGLLVPFLDSERLAASIISLLADESLNKTMGWEARKTIEKSFSAERCAQETYNVYRHVLDRNH